MPLFSRPQRSSSNPPLVRRISTLIRRRLSFTMADQEPSPSSNATQESATSFTLPSPAQLEPKFDALSLEASSSSIPNDASSQSTDQESQTNAIELRDDAIDEADFLDECFSTSPPSPSQPSSTYTFTTLDPLLTPYSHPNPLSQTIYTIYTPMPIEERLQRRQECFFHLQRLHQGLTQDPFGEWTDLANGLYGGTIPPEFYLDSAPFTLHSLRGRVRLRYIRTAFCMPIDSTVVEIESFLSRNPSIVRYLVFNVLPNPDRVIRETSRDYHVHVNRPTSQQYNKHLLHAIKQLDWIDETADWVAGLARAEDMRTLSTLYKVREVEILPSVWKKMKEMEELWKPIKMDKLHARVVAQMQRNRPNSLLRSVVSPQDVVEKSP
ncbi:hypothetical protein V8C42DRAFT_322187 [Trichoderma barbatum]